MFLFESLNISQIMMWFVVLGALILFNEITRRSKWLGVFAFIVFPLIMSFTVWPKTAGPDTSVGTWFHWAKLYSVLIATLIFMGIRYIPKMRTSKIALTLVPTILGLNILEAVIRDFQCYSINGFVDGMEILGGPWNIMNGIAGILNIIALSGWLGIYVMKNKSQDMIWPDQMWFWIIAYDLWNFAYTYNCVPSHSYYAGAALLLSCTIPAFFIVKGAWIQHRGHTLSGWMMFVMTFPNFVDFSAYAVKSSLNPSALILVSGLSLVANVALVIYHFARLGKKEDKKTSVLESVYC